MWYLEYEIADLQEEFAKEMGSFDTENMTVDFIEDGVVFAGLETISIFWLFNFKQISNLSSSSTCFIFRPSYRASVISVDYVYKRRFEL